MKILQELSLNYHQINVSSNTHLISSADNWNPLYHNWPMFHHGKNINRDFRTTIKH